MHKPRNTHLAQVNVAFAIEEMDSPRSADLRLAEFMSALDEVDAVAERSPGFIWWLQSQVRYHDV
jgi:hypothetical protein